MPERDNGKVGAAGRLAGLARAAVREPFGRRAGRELLFCLVEVPLGLFPVGALLAVFGMAAASALLATGAADRPPASAAALAAGAVAVALLVALAGRVARRLARVHRQLAARLLGVRVAAPPRRDHDGRPLGWLGALRDPPSWRAVAYLLLKPAVAVLELYAVFVWVAGPVNLSYPFWWRSFRNHPPDVRLDPVAVATPFGAFHVESFAGTFAVSATGAAMVLTAPWVARAVTSLDLWLIRALLGPGGLAQRVRDLEQTRALAVDDAAALLRRLERDLHDGAQVRLATLALNLGMAREKLAGGGDELDQARELIDAAHRGAKDALVELRDLARGIHPPMLDNGLADALATLAAGSAIPVDLATDIPVRPAPAIETIAYFCAAELLANAAKHSGASRIGIRATGRRGMLWLAVADDGAGGADPRRRGGLTGLAQRVSTVDGHLAIASPPGGPTRITVELPLRT